MNKLFMLSDVYLNDKVILDKQDDIELLTGQIILNRIVNIAYDNMDRFTLHADIRKSFDILQQKNIKKSNIFRGDLDYLANVLKNVTCEYALLKGAFLSTNLYTNGYRTSNDIDILVEAKNVSKIQSLLKENGFKQGYLDHNGNINPATRKQIIESKMNFGETVPFLKMTQGRVLEVDINFSIDFKPSDNTQLIGELLSTAVLVTVDTVEFKTLDKFDFLIHLCCHLYKEATTYDWVARRRDLMLYKFSDINVFLHEFGCKDYCSKLLSRIRQFGVEQECYYTFENSSIIYPKINSIEGFDGLMKELKPTDLGFMQQIIYPRENKRFKYDMDFEDWFFCPNRIAQLEEIKNETP